MKYFCNNACCKNLTGALRPNYSTTHQYIILHWCFTFFLFLPSVSSEHSRLHLHFIIGKFLKFQNAPVSWLPLPPGLGCCVPVLHVSSATWYHGHQSGRGTPSHCTSSGGRRSSSWCSHRLCLQYWIWRIWAAHPLVWDSVDEKNDTDSIQTRNQTHFCGLASTKLIVNSRCQVGGKFACTGTTNCQSWAPNSS